MFDKPFDSVTREDIDALVSNKVPESKTLEYKQGPVGRTDSDRKEFLRDISSFANASGGDILYGITEERNAEGKTGAPEAAVGLEGVNSQEEVSRMENMIRDGIDPRIAGIHTKPIPGFPKGDIILVRIPKSWRSPHMVAVEKDSRFYSRTSNGKYPLNVSEIGAAFSLSEALPERIRRFRDERVGRIIADETPVRLSAEAKLVLHLLPYTAFDLGTRLDMAVLAEQRDVLPCIGGSTRWKRFNLDGLLGFVQEDGSASACREYVQLFRSGAIEAVSTDLLRDLPDRQGQKFVPIYVVEALSVAALTAYLELEREMGINPPMILMLSLLGVKGAVIPKDRRSMILVPPPPIDRSDLLLPDLVIPDYGNEVPTILQPAFDMIWQAAGYPRSANYDLSGKWLDRWSQEMR